MIFTLPYDCAIEELQACEAGFISMAAQELLDRKSDNLSNKDISALQGMVSTYDNDANAFEYWEDFVEADVDSMSEFDLKRHMVRIIGLVATKDTAEKQTDLLDRI